MLQTIDPKEIADEQMRQTVELLLNLIEQLYSKVIELEAETQKLRDKNNRSLARIILFANNLQIIPLMVCGYLNNYLAPKF